MTQNEFEKNISKEALFKKELTQLKSSIAKQDKTAVEKKEFDQYTRAPELSDLFKKALKYKKGILHPTLHVSPIKLDQDINETDKKYLSSIKKLNLIWNGKGLPSWLTDLENIEHLTISNLTIIPEDKIPKAKIINGQSIESIPFKEFRTKWLDRKDIIFAGDSNMVDITRNTENKNIQNIQCKGGRNIYEIEKNIQLSPTTKSVIIIGGGNDLKQNIPPQIIFENLKKMIQKIRRNNPQTHIILGTITPRKQKSELLAKKAQVVNNLIQKLYEKQKKETPQSIHLIDWHDQLNNRLDKMSYNPAFISDDLVHANKIGYEKMRYILDQALEKIINDF